MKRIAILLCAVAIAVSLGVAFERGGFFSGKPLFATPNGAIDGYDPVGYFKQGEAVRGDAAYTVSWKGETWRFADDENMQAFEADPEKYAPQYGGYCAYGMSEGYLADVDPTAWTIVDGRLYLNFDKGVMESWRETKERRIPQADRNWESH